MLSWANNVSLEFCEDMRCRTDYVSLEFCEDMRSRVDHKSPEFCEVVTYMVLVTQRVRHRYQSGIWVGSCHQANDFQVVDEESFEVDQEHIHLHEDNAYEMSDARDHITGAMWMDYIQNH
ncbi:hypothetical protein L3X38_024943 [Prunus dulcis]|uniref:Uncharacterized protein n=1 Tax=Prunus dulcis TaxID=3755 RepID=A0AAD4Z6M3_PRUDU|nr:hypothetical protein L3X38_024943 [Prunus dulcis]